MNIDFNDRIKPIETTYNGCKFRSRLEARWAVFFDSLGISWEYEKEGYHLDEFKYLPDFWLPDYQYWLEVKGTTPTQEEIKKCQLLQELSGFPVVLAVGQPHMNRNTVFYCETSDSGGGFAEKENAKWFYCTHCQNFDLDVCSKNSSHSLVNGHGWEILGKCFCSNVTGILYFTRELKQACDKARQARFEQLEGKRETRDPSIASSGYKVNLTGGYRLTEKEVIDKAQGGE